MIEDERNCGECQTPLNPGEECDCPYVQANKVEPLEKQVARLKKLLRKVVRAHDANAHPCCGVCDRECGEMMPVLEKIEKELKR